MALRAKLSSKLSPTRQLGQALGGKKTAELMWKPLIFHAAPTLRNWIEIVAGPFAKSASTVWLPIV